MPDKEARLLWGLKNQAAKIRKSRGTDDEWKENLAWFKGEQTQDKVGWKANTVTNFLFSQIMTIVPILANRIPEVSLKPITENLTREADVLSKLINRTFIRNELIGRQVELVMNGLLFGKGFWKVAWDTVPFAGMGDFRIETPDTRSIFLEPGKDSLRDANFLFESRNINKLTLMRMYPDKRDLIKKLFQKDKGAVDEFQGVGGNTGETGLHATKDPDPVATTSEALIWDMAMGAPADKESVEVSDAWFLDETTYKDFIETTTEGKGKKTKVELDFPEFPTGRLVVFSGQEALLKKPNPFPQFPFVEYINYVSPDEPDGISDLKHAKPQQEMYNIRHNQIMDLLNFNLGPVTFYDHTSGIEPDEIENRPNQYVPVMNVQGMKRFDPPRIPAEAFNSLLILRQNLETIFGVREVTQGSVPGDVKSGFAIEQLQEAAQGRLRLKTRNIEASIRGLSKYLVRMIGLFYIRGEHYTDDVDLDGVDPDFFDFEIKAGVNLPGSRIAEQQHDQWLFANGIVDEEFIISRSNINNRESLEDRMRPFWEARRAQLQNPQGAGQLQ